MLYKYKIGDCVRFKSYTTNDIGIVVKRHRRGLGKLYSIKCDGIHGNVPEKEIYEKIKIGG